MPSELGLLSRLTYLDIQHNSLSSTLPTSLKALTSLTTFLVANNGLLCGDNVLNTPAYLITGEPSLPPPP